MKATLLPALALAVVMSLTAISPVSADVIAAWTFPTDTSIVYPGGGTISNPYAANVGTGTLTAFRQVSSPTSVIGGSDASVNTFDNSSVPTINDGTGSLSLGASGTITRQIIIEFEFSTLGMEDIVLSFDGRRISFTGTTPLLGEVSIDGGATFVPGTGFGLPTFDAWNHSVADFSAIDILDNQPSVLVRMVGKQGNFDPHGTRLDNFTVMATAIPEASTIGMMSVAALGVAGTVIRRRRNS